jgi:hypothetical protein
VFEGGLVEAHLSRIARSDAQRDPTCDEDPASPVLVTHAGALEKRAAFFQ